MFITPYQIDNDSSEEAPKSLSQIAQELKSFMMRRILNSQPSLQ